MTKRLLAWAVLALLFALHHDAWLWDAPHRLGWAAGLPAGFVYHVAYCVAAAAAMAFLVRAAWPATPAPADEHPAEGGQR